MVLTGAGISAESGLKTFRDSGGLWEGHDVMEVASIDGWRKNPELVLDFYNQRRSQAKQSKPNPGHIALAKLEEDFDVTIVTQNVDVLHETAGSHKVIHLHGNLFQSKSSVDESLIYDIGEEEIKMGDLCEKGSQLRPNIVWFGEMVPMMEKAAAVTMQADAFLVVGTSLVVYPAAGLVNYVSEMAPIYFIDPHIPEVSPRENLFLFQEPASTGVIKAVDHLKKFL